MFTQYIGSEINWLDTLTRRMFEMNEYIPANAFCCVSISHITIPKLGSQAERINLSLLQMLLYLNSTACLFQINDTVS